jgi:hypothetical protein
LQHTETTTELTPTSAQVFPHKNAGRFAAQKYYTKNILPTDKSIFIVD